MTAPTMSFRDSFQTNCYHSHYEQYKKYACGGTNEPRGRTCLEGDTVDAWRHERMYRVLDPLS
jgi:hypothetical protein